eukprot:gene8784-13893_t
MLHPSAVNVALLAVAVGCLVADVTYAQNCKDSTACDPGERFDGSGTKDATCPACPANTFLGNTGHFISTCKPQPQCTAGEKITDDSKEVIRVCSDCAPNFYQTSTGHRDTSCTEQPYCKAGQRMDADTTTARRGCTACRENTYHSPGDHRDTSCENQITCGAGQGFEVGVVQNDGATTAGSCYPCVAGGSSGQYHEASTHREDCKTQRQCAKGQFFKGSNTERGVCTTCVGFTYQERESTRVETCKLQKTCGPGFRFEEASKGAKTWEGQCLACDPGTYRSESIHRETTCLAQILCTKGAIFTSNGAK